MCFIVFVSLCVVYCFVCCVLFCVLCVTFCDVCYSVLCVTVVPPPPGINSLAVIKIIYIIYNVDKRQIRKFISL